MTIVTIPSSERRAGPYTATAGQTVFGFAFPVYAAADVDVWRQRGAAVDLLTLGTHYTVTGAGEQSGGSVVLTSGALAGDIIAIHGDLLKQRATSFIGGNPFKTAFIDADLNRLAVMVQELAREVGRAIRRAPVDETAGSLNLPLDVTENTILALNASGALIGLVAASFQGDPGPAGPAGISVRSGMGAPSGATGNNGDFYIDIAEYDLYGPKTGGVWGTGVSLVGPAGAGTGDVTGPAGATVGHVAVFSHASGKQIAGATPTSGPPALTNAANVFGQAQTVERGIDGDGWIARNSDNTAAQRSHLRAERGSGAGSDYLLASLGDTSNGIAALLELIGATELRRAVAGSSGYTRYTRQIVACSADTLPALTDGATVNWDWANQQTASLTLGGNRTLNTPANARPGATAMLFLTATGATRTVALTSDYSLPDGIVSPLTIEAGDTWVLAVFYTGTRYLAVPTKFEPVP
jgi:hypothetical protein